MAKVSRLPAKAVEAAARVLRNGRALFLDSSAPQTAAPPLKIPSKIVLPPKFKHLRGINRTLVWLRLKSRPVTDQISVWVQVRGTPIGAKAMEGKVDKLIGAKVLDDVAISHSALESNLPLQNSERESTVSSGISTSGSPGPGGDSVLSRSSKKRSRLPETGVAGSPGKKLKSSHESQINDDAASVQPVFSELADAQVGSSPATALTGAATVPTISTEQSDIRSRRDVRGETPGPNTHSKAAGTAQLDMGSSEALIEAEVAGVEVNVDQAIVLSQVVPATTDADSVDDYSVQPEAPFVDWTGAGSHFSNTSSIYQTSQVRTNTSTSSAGIPSKRFQDTTDSNEESHLATSDKPDSISTERSFASAIATNPTPEDADSQTPIPELAIQPQSSDRIHSPKRSFETIADGGSADSSKIKRRNTGEKDPDTMSEHVVPQDVNKLGSTESTGGPPAYDDFRTTVYNLLDYPAGPGDNPLCPAYIHKSNKNPRLHQLRDKTLIARPGLEYSRVSENRAGQIGISFNLNRVEAKRRVEESISVDMAILHYFMWIDAAFVRSHKGQFVRQLWYKLPDVVELITGCEGPDAADALRIMLDDQNCQDPNDPYQPLAPHEIFNAMFAGLITKRVFMQPLLSKLGFPGVSSVVIDEIAELYDFVDDQYKNESLMLRYKWRDFRSSYLDRPAVRAAQEQLCNAILTEFDRCMVFFLENDDVQELPDEFYRGILRRAIDEAILLKCQMELSNDKYEFAWPTSNGLQFDDNTMQSQSLIRKDAHRGVEPRKRQNIRFAVSPTAFIFEQADEESDQGYEAWELERQTTKGHTNVSENRGFRMKRLLCQSRVIVWDGNIKETIDRPPIEDSDDEL